MVLICHLKTYKISRLNIYEEIFAEKSLHILGCVPKKKNQGFGV